METDVLLEDERALDGDGQVTVDGDCVEIELLQIEDGVSLSPYDGVGDVERVHGPEAGGGHDLGVG